MAPRLLWAALGLACLLAAAGGTSAAPGARRRLAQAAAVLASPAAAAPAAPAPAAEGGACCEQLAAIGFSSNLPVVVLDTAGQPLVTKGLDVPIRMCTCNSGGHRVWEQAPQRRPHERSPACRAAQHRTSCAVLCTELRWRTRLFCSAGQPFKDYEGLASAAVRGTSELGDALLDGTRLCSRRMAPANLRMPPCACVPTNILSWPVRWCS